MLRVVDGGVFVCLGRTADFAADRIGARNANSATGQQVVKRRGQIAFGWRWTVHAEAELVVHPAAIADDPLFIEDEDLRRPLHGERVGQLVTDIFQERKR